MNAERFRRICEVFEAARTLTGGARADLLARECEGDAALRTEVEELLRHHDAPDGPLDAPAAVSRVAGAAVGDVVGGRRLVAPLGEGGMGTVFVAEEEGGARVAVKVLHTHLGASRRHRERFLREARLGAAVRHPGVVRVLDAGVDADEAGGAAYLVMELVEGQSLRELCEELGRVPEELCRHVARELADALAAIHAAGVVHRDVKPDNILITPDHVLRLTDLGVAHVRDASEELSHTGAFVGSLAYASPEQFATGTVRLDGRADLHALGIVLYELASGANPFAGGDLAAVTRRVLDVVPPRLGERNPQVSAFFEELVHTLLAKDPDERFASAAALRDVLDAGEDAPWWRARRDELRARAHGRLRRIRIPRATALHGRDAEMTELAQAFADVVGGRGAVVLVQGEPGIGKTRLVDEFVARLEREAELPHVLYGGAAPGAAAGATSAVLHALREHFGGDDVAAACARLLPESPALVAGLVARLAGNAAAAPLAQDALEAAVIRVVQALAATRPVVFVVDDLQFASAEGRALFHALALGVAAHRVLLVGTARPGLPERFVAGLAALPHVRRLALARLGPRDLGRLLVEALGSERLADELGWQLARSSDGNPFFVFEIVRSLQESGRLRRGTDGTWHTTGVLAEIEIPSTVVDLIAARLAELAEDEQEVLDVAACAGFEFDPRDVAAALGAARIPVLRTLGRIERRLGLVRAAGPRFVFDHHQIQETVAARLSPALAAAYHAELGEALQRRALASADATELAGEIAARLAEHFLRGGCGDRARPYLASALVHVEARSAEHAAALCRLALDASPPPPATERLATLVRLLGCLDHIGRPAEYAPTLDAALALADECGDADVLLDLRGRRALLCVAEGRHDDAAALLDAALDEARARGARRQECRMLGHRGAVEAARAQHAEARTWHGRALDLAREIGDAEIEAAALGGVGNAAWALGEYDAAFRCDEAALAIARACGDRRRESVAVGNLGTLWSARGDYTRALALQRERLHIAREIGYRRGEAIATGNLAIQLAILGRPDEACALHERQIVLCREIAHAHGEASALVSLALAHVGAGRFETALEPCRRGTELAQRLGARGLVASGEQLLGDTLHALGRADEARAHFAAATELATQVGSAMESVISALLAARLPGGDVAAARALYLAHRERLALRARMHAEHLMYQLTGERAHLDAAWERLRHVRDHAPVEYRASMLVHQPIHRAIVEDLATLGIDASV